MNWLDTDCYASADDEHRYWLSRQTRALNFLTYQRIIFLMLNPSKARGEDKGDPTQRKCDGFAHRLGAASYGLVNLFAYSTPYPELLFAKGYGHALGPENPRVLRSTLWCAKVHGWPVICAWGKPTKLSKKEREEIMGRQVREVVRIANAFNLPLYSLATTDDGYPRHPLMLGYDQAHLTT